MAYTRFVVLSGQTRTLDIGTTYTNLYAENGGAGEVKEGGVLTGNTVSISGNSASLLGGGAIYNEGTVSISGSTLSGNTADGLGGAICNAYGTVSISGSTLSGNSSPQFGGAILNAGTVSISGSTLSGNTAGYYGGAIYNYGDSTISISGSTLSGNTAASQGGAILNNGTVSISGSTFSGNTASKGGAIYNGSGSKVNFTGEVTLGTSTDTIYNSGTLIWNLTGDDTTGKLNGYQWLTNAGALSITVKEETSDAAYTIATGNFTNVTNKNTFSLTGVDGQTDASITIGGTAYYNGFVYSLTVIDGNKLVLSNWRGENVYVNSTYSGEIGTEVGDHYIMGVNAYNNYTEAKAAAVATVNRTIIQTGGTFDYNVVLDGKTLVVNAGEETKMLTGGKAISNDIKVWQNETGDTSVTVNDGLFKNVFSCADIVSNGSAERKGNVKLTITGGIFKAGANGGMFFRTAERSKTKYAQDTVWLTGNIDFTISGGIFEYDVYGGNASVDTNDPVYYDASKCTVVEGNITLTLDASTKDLTFNNAGSAVVDVFAGSAGEGTVYGTTTVVVKGSHDIDIEGTLSGGSRADFVAIQEGTRTMRSNVSGSRTLEFSGFNKGSGNANTLDCKLFMFDTMVFKDNSIVELTYSSNFQDVENWTFEEGSSADIGNANNSFAGDTLNFTNLNALEAESTWKVLTAKESALDILNASAVNFDNEAAAKTESGWTLGGYTLSIVDSAEAGMKDMVITRSLA